ncbi:CbiX/SirB N-terminal domain-containing protein [Haloactinospora alba]
MVLAAAGSSDASAAAEAGAAARRLSHRLGTGVRVGYIAIGRPTVADVVADARAGEKTRVAVAPWLLAPGLFHDSLPEAGADVVAEPLCPDVGVVDAVLARYREAAARRPDRGP